MKKKCRVYKYILVLHGNVQTSTMPKDAKILSVQIQSDRITVWALVDVNATAVSRKSFLVVGTGHDIQEPIETLMFLGTVQTGQFVWHVFEVV